MTEDICIAAVSTYPSNLQYVKVQTDRVCLAAIRSENFFPEVMSFIKNQKKHLCLEAIRKRSDSLEYIKDQTEEICLAAIQINPFALTCVRHQTASLCSKAVEINYQSLEYVKEQTQDICLTAVRANYRALQYVNEKTPEICLESIAAGGIDALHFIDPVMLSFLYETAPEVFDKAIPEYKTLFSKEAARRSRQIAKKREEGKLPLYFETKEDLATVLRRSVIEKAGTEKINPRFISYWANIIFDIYRMLNDEYGYLDVYFRADENVYFTVSKTVGNKLKLKFNMSIKNGDNKIEYLDHSAKPIDILEKIMEMAGYHQ